MRKVSTENIGPAGHIVAVDVVGTAGNTLLSKGAAITPTLGKRIRNWGIEYVFVEGEDDAEESVKVKARTPQEIYRELYGMFEGTLENARMKTIFDAVHAHKLQKLGGGGGIANTSP